MSLEIFGSTLWMFNQKLDCDVLFQSMLKITCMTQAGCMFGSPRVFSTMPYVWSKLVPRHLHLAHFRMTLELCLLAVILRRIIVSSSCLPLPLKSLHNLSAVYPCSGYLRRVIVNKKSNGIEIISPTSLFREKFSQNHGEQSIDFTIE